jgi:hypothetical protein
VSADAGDGAEADALVVDEAGAEARAKPVAEAVADAKISTVNAEIRRQVAQVMMSFSRRYNEKPLPLRR